MPLNGLISLSATVILSIYILSVTTFIILLKINFINLFDVQICHWVYSNGKQTYWIKDNGLVLIFTRHVIKYREKSVLR